MKSYLPRNLRDVDNAVQYLATIQVIASIHTLSAPRYLSPYRLHGPSAVDNEEGA